LITSLDYKQYKTEQT